MAAFQEGIAHITASLWMWARDAAPVSPNANLGPGPHIPRLNTGVSLEFADQAGFGCQDEVTLPGFPPLVVSMGHRRAMCIARGIWDIVDANDSISGRHLGHVVSALRAYPDVCIPLVGDNRCSSEIGVDDGVNWSDFRANFTATFGTGLGGTETLNRLENSDDN